MKDALYLGTYWGIGKTVCVCGIIVKDGKEIKEVYYFSNIGDIIRCYMRAVQAGLSALVSDEIMFFYLERDTEIIDDVLDNLGSMAQVYAVVAEDFDRKCVVKCKHCIELAEHYSKAHNI